MAKKGGTSEINGFVSIKTDDGNKTRQKVSTRTSGATTNIKSNTSKTSKKELPDDGVKSTKVVNKDVDVNKTKQETSINTGRNKGAIERNKRQESSASKVTSKEKIENKIKRESSVAKISQSSKNITSDSKNRLQGNIKKNVEPIRKSIKETPLNQVNKGKTNETTSSKRLPTEQKNNKPIVSENVSKSKGSTNPAERGTSLVANRSSEKIQRGSSKDTKIKSTSKDSVVKEKKKELEASKKEGSKKTSVTKKTAESIDNHKNSISSKSGKVVMKQNTVTRSKPNHNEKDNKYLSNLKINNQEHLHDVNISEPDISVINDESSKEGAAIKHNYKDMIYFEVDMVDSKEPKARVPSARIKSATSQPRPVTRQGTFTKDESPNRLESEAHLKKEHSVENLLTQDDSEEVEYEDDFEDYESDFEEYVSESESESGLSSTSVTDSHKDDIKSSIKTEPVQVLKSVKKVLEEERKLDSGNYDLSSKTVFPSSVKQKQLDLIKEAINQENLSLFDKRKKITVPEEKKGESNVVVLDFFSALKKKEHVQQVEKEKQRSSIILQMISLHEQKIDLFEGIFSDDDLFEDIYQNKNVSHTFTQTKPIMNEESSQTNDVLVQNKWTQNPISYHSWTSTSFSFIAFMEDQRGYGGDNLTIDYKSWWNTKYNVKKLYNFIDSASKVVLVLLEEEARWRSSEKSMSITNPKDDLGFSDGCISMQTEKLIFLQERPICDIVFSPHDSNIFVSSHRFAQEIEKLPSFIDQFFGRSILCVWSMLQPSQPLYLLVASCQICAVTFDSEYNNFLYAGLTDGSVCLWDLNESSMYHKESTAGSMEYLLRTPTFCTSHLVGKDYHHNVIVSMKSIGYESYGNISSRKFNPTQIVTLDTDGIVVLWIVTRTLSALERTDHSFDKVDYGISHWGKFKLVMGKTLNPESILPDSEIKWGLQFLCMDLAPDYDSNERKHMKSILVGTNIGNIIHFYTTEDEVDVPVFTNELGDNNAISVMTLEKNPHGFPLFMAGCNDGCIRFYVLDKPEPFKIITFDEDFVYTPIIKIRWSPLGLGLFFVLDKNFSLHFWDICKDGRAPQISVSLKPLQAAHFDVTCDNKFVYIGISVQRFNIDIHRVKEKFITTNSEEEKDFFINLVKSNSLLFEENTSFDPLI